jgi:flagellar FliL protein
MAVEAEQAEGEEQTEKPSGGRKRLIIALAALLVLGGGGFAGWKMFAGKQDGTKAEAKQEPKQPPRYINLDPPFVVNFEAESMVRFLQVTIGVMTRDPAIETLVKDNDPRVRNDLLMILANQSYDTVSTAEGKEALRKRCLESIRAIVREMGGDSKQVEALYFTSFVMQ